MEPAAEQQQQLRSLRDFLLVYNRMTELCFRRCVSDLGYRLLSRRESWSLCKAPEEHEDFCTRGSETCHGRQLHTWGAVTACVRVQELSKGFTDRDQGALCSGNALFKWNSNRLRLFAEHNYSCSVT
ncbi:mitochondrial import inner membrane translocase subunit Tim10 B isoform X4 [Numida meleagris]|uniref:mitochondrial import inner membrane translocase subunit Tim10 B isoform X4 n=1 Tax=Numida meleagris TaxID=8996 RepID=UPI000B3D9FD1|nr:mitochondrial import inner membrane translocase subunit Tim10 B isoform X4 [Numida meleagris]